MPDDTSINDIFLKLGEMQGTMKTFVDSQIKLNDVIFQTQRKHDNGINSLLQTRRTQWKIITLAISGWAVVSEYIHRILG